MMNFLPGGTATMQFFSAASLFSAYTSVTALITLIQQFYYQFVPKQVRNYINKTLEQWFTKPSSPTSLFTLVIEQVVDGDYHLDNQVFNACEAYLATKLKFSSRRLKVSRPDSKDLLTFKLAQGENYTEYFEGVQLEWSFICNNETDAKKATRNNKYFELSFDPGQKSKVFDSYLPFIHQYYDDLMEKRKELKLYSHEGGSSGRWSSVKFRHPFTFDALALDPVLKSTVIDDVERFMKRKEFYKKIGRAWKRGYLLYGPPGTGKSSLVAAMANHIKFNIYDLQLSSVVNDSVLRRLLLSTKNKSILVIEDIDCSLGFANRQRRCGGDGKDEDLSDIDHGRQISMSGLLNFIDGLWSSCGDERIIIFTTNYKDRLDPALLRPGRMDMHIHMSYLTMPGFRVLASNYLDISGEHPLFGEIEELIQKTSVTPAQVAEELLRSDDPDIALSKVVEMLKGNNKAEPIEKEKTGKRIIKRTKHEDEITETTRSFMDFAYSDSDSDDYSRFSSGSTSFSD